MDGIRLHGLTRREMIARTLKAGAYAAPAVLALATVSPVAAASPTVSTVVTFGQDTAISGVFGGSQIDVYYTLSTQPVTMLTLLGTIPTDRFGFGGVVFPLTVDTAAVTSVTLTYILHGNPPTSPPATTFTSTLVAALKPGTAAQLLGLVVQEPTVAACTTGPLTTYNEYLDVALTNVAPGAAYDLYVQPAGVAAPVKAPAGPFTANGQGEVTIFTAVPVTLPSVTVPASVTVTAVAAGGSPATPAFALVATPPAPPAGTLLTINCADLTAGARGAKSFGITR